MTDTVVLRVYDPSNTTLLGTLHNAYGRSFVAELNGPGVGRFMMDVDDPQYALVQPRRVVRWRINGTDRHATIIDDMPRNLTGDPEPAAAVVTGPGLAGWLGTAKGGAVIYPPRLRTRQMTRYFGWAASTGYSAPTVDGWGMAHAGHTVGRYDRPSGHLPRLIGEPANWPDKASQWMAPGPLTTHSDGRAYHPGTNEFLLWRRLPAVGPFPARIWTVGTNEWDLYFDGERVASGGGFRDVVETDIQFENRPVVVAFHLRHERNPAFKYDPAILMSTIRRIDENGDPGAMLFRTYTTDRQPGNPAQTWRINPNPESMPGVTPGRIVRDLVNEAKARGWGPGLTPTFTATEDSNGQAWAVDDLNHSYPVGTKLSDVIDQVVEQTGVEYRVRPTGHLDLANRIGVNRPGALSPRYETAADGRGVRATVILGGAGNGFLERVSAPRVTQYGRIEDAVVFGTEPSRLGLGRYLQRLLTASSRVSDQWELSLAPSAPRPFADFGLGDSYPDGRVTQITMTQEDAAADVDWAVTLSPEE